MTELMKNAAELIELQILSSPIAYAPLELPRSSGHPPPAPGFARMSYVRVSFLCSACIGASPRAKWMPIAVLSRVGSSVWTFAFT